MKTIKINDLDQTGREYRRNAEEAIIDHALKQPGAQTLRYRVNVRVLDGIWFRTKIPIDRDSDPMSMRLHRGGRHQIIVELDDTVPDGEIRTPENESGASGDAERRALREALTAAIRECEVHNSEYRYRTDPELIAAWRRLVGGDAVQQRAPVRLEVCRGCGAEVERTDVTDRCDACRAKIGLPPLSEVRRAAKEACAESDARPAGRPIAIDAIVRLRSGGPDMRVVDMQPGRARGDAIDAVVTWSDFNGNPQRERYDVRCLERVP